MVAISAGSLRELKRIEGMSEKGGDYAPRYRALLTWLCVCVCTFSELDLLSGL